MRKKEETLLLELERVARLIAFCKHSEDDLKIEIETLRLTCNALDELRQQKPYAGLSEIIDKKEPKAKEEEKDRCEDCAHKDFCVRGEEPCGSYELPESEVVKIYNGERYI